MFDDEEYLFHVLRNGAKGYILKNAPDEQLLLAIRTVYKGETCRYETYNIFSE